MSRMFQKEVTSKKGTKQEMLPVLDAKPSGRYLRLTFRSEPPFLDRIEFRFDQELPPSYFQRGDQRFPLNWPKVEPAVSLCFLHYVEWHLGKKSGRFFFGAEPAIAEFARRLSGAVNQNEHKLHDLFYGENPRSDDGDVTHLVFPDAPGISKSGRSKSKPVMLVIGEQFLPPDSVEISWDRDSSGTEALLIGLPAIRELLNRVRESVGLDPMGNERPYRAATGASLELRKLGGQWPDPGIDGKKMPEERLLRLHQLPAAPAAFTGRDEEIAKIEKELSIKNVVVLSGMPGVGKTSLAVVIANRLKLRFPDAQIMLNLRGAGGDQTGQYLRSNLKAVSHVEAMQSVIRAFHPEAKLPRTSDELAAMYRAVLQAKRETTGKKVHRRVLLLLDNAADAAQVRPLLPPPNCGLIVSSRSRFELPGIATFPIDCLTPKHAQKLLCKVAKRIKGHEEEAAKLCGHLPLALEVFAGVVNNKSLHPVPELLEQFRALAQRLPLVDAAFQVSYELLDKQDRWRWRALAVFPSSFDLSAAAAIWKKEAPNPRERTFEGIDLSRSAIEDYPTSETRDLMEVFVKRSLVEFDETEGRLRLHDLLRHFGAAKLNEDRSEYERVMLRYVHYCHRLMLEFHRLLARGGEDAIYCLQFQERELPHVEFVIEWLSHRRDKESASLLLSLFHVIIEEFAEVHSNPIRCFLRLRNAARIVRDRYVEVWALKHIGFVLLNRGDIRRAPKFLRRSLEMCLERASQSERWRQLQCSNLAGLGKVQLRLGDTNEAMRCFQQCLNICRDIEDEGGECKSLKCFGEAHECAGSWRLALDFYEKAMAVARQSRDPLVKHLGCEAQWASARVLARTGRTKLAFDRAKNALQTFRRNMKIPVTSLRAEVAAWAKGRTIRDVGCRCSYQSW